MVVQHNISALNAHRQMGVNNTGTAKNLEKLSSGFRINRAGDDAAGLAISEKMRGQIRGLDMASQNAQNGVSLVQTAEGGLNETHAILQRMRELAVQSSNGTYHDDVDRENLNKEVTALKSELDRIASSTNYNGINLLDGSMGNSKLGATAAANDTILAQAGVTADATIESVAGSAVDGKSGNIIVREDGSAALQVEGKSYALDKNGTEFKDAEGNTVAKLSAAFTGGSGVLKGVELKDTATAFNTMEGATVSGSNSEMKFQIGANGSSDQQVSLKLGNMSASNIGDIENGKFVSNIGIGSQDDANAAIEIIDMAINQVSGARADLGAMQNRLEHTINNLGTTKENLTASESLIRDVDMAKEMMEFTKNNILVQTSQAMLSQANNLPQGVLQLLK